MRKTGLSILLLFALAGSALLAQGPPPGPPGPPDPAVMVQHKVKFLTTVLSLTPAQQQQATTIFTNAAGSMKSLHDSMKAAHQSLATAIKNNDSAGIEQAAATIGNLTAQRVSSESKAQAAFRQILTPEQQAKADELKAEGGPMHMRMGPH